MFTNQSLLITGGTGSFGNAVLRRVLKSDISEIRVLSRDEKKQDEQRASYSDSRLRYILGDTRDRDSVISSMRGVDVVFHAAALKQVPSCEFFPLEAVKTNILGTENVLEAAIQTGVKRVVCLSTDKAVYPVNAMGLSKALMEKVAVSMSGRLRGSNTVICTTRYGNVLGSRGSVVPLFLKQLRDGVSLTVTNPEMTRFMMTLDDAIDLVLFALEKGDNGEIYVQKSPATTIQTLAKAVLTLANRVEYPIEVIGTRHGEKLHEVLLGREEMMMTDDLGRYFRIRPDVRGLNYAKYISKGVINSETMTEYSSNNTEQLSLEQVIVLLQRDNLVSKLFLDGAATSIML